MHKNIDEKEIYNTGKRLNKYSKEKIYSTSEQGLNQDVERGAALERITHIVIDTFDIKKESTKICLLQYFTV